MATWTGFVYVAFAIDLFSRAVVGWSIATVKDVTFVEACLKMALWRRDHLSRPIPAGWCTTAITPRLTLCRGIVGSLVLVGRRD
jgi:transposase InsO family protein